MTNKPTDNEIIKALECCGRDYVADCDHCVLNDLNRNDCYSLILHKYSLDLINRLKAENERLDKLVVEKHKEINRLDDYMQYVKAEAIKEFAERLISKCDAPHWCVWMSEIDDLAKEMVGDTDA